MAGFIINEVFTSMGFVISYDREYMFFGFENCTPLGGLIQVNSLYPMGENEIISRLHLFKREFANVPLPVIFSTKGFIRDAGIYEDQAFLMDINSIKDIREGKDIFNEMLWGIINRGGKPVKGSSLDYWIEEKIRLYMDCKLPANEADLLVANKIVCPQMSTIDGWKNNLQEYLRIINIPKGNNMPSKKLENWASRQFEEYENGTMSQQKQQLLLESGAIWPDDCLLTEKYIELSDFIKRKKRLPFAYECKLYRFMNAQRKHKWINELSPELREIIIGLDPFFDDDAESWLPEFNKVNEEYISCKKHIWELSKDSISWLNRQVYENEKSKLPAYKEKKLRRYLDWNNEVIDYEWLSMYRKYHEAASLPDVGDPLWHWCVQQRTSDLNRYKKKILQESGFDFNGINSHWYNCYKRMEESESVHRKNDSYIGKDGIYWAASNRRLYAEGKLGAEKIALLEKIGFDFKLDTFSWLIQCGIIRLFYTINTVKDRKILTPEMMDWCAEQRKRMYAVELSMPQTDKLIGFGFILEDQHFEEFLMQFRIMICANGGLPADYLSRPWISKSLLRVAFAREVEFILSPESSSLPVSCMAYLPSLINFWKNEEERWLSYMDKIQDCANYIRKSRVNGELDVIIIKQLDDVGFNWEEECIEKWLYMLAKTKRYIWLYKRVPGPNAKDCSVWRYQQLRSYKAGKLSEFKQRAIEPVRNYLQLDQSILDDGNLGDE